MVGPRQWLVAGSEIEGVCQDLYNPRRWPVVEQWSTRRASTRAAITTTVVKRRRKYSVEIDQLPNLERRGYGYTSFAGWSALRPR